MKRQHTILLISNDAPFAREARLQLSACLDGLRLTTVDNLEAAWRAIEQSVPDVILLQSAAEAARVRSELQSIVQSLANYAPVVVLGAREFQREISALVSAGAADYVASEEGLSGVIRVVRRHLCAETVVKLVPPQQLSGNEDFGEVLRHELNNPLTGILGNAELLLSEIRRKHDGKLPQGGQQRVETIAALAVRLRETVRRLSQQWESQRSASAAMRHG